MSDFKKELKPFLKENDNNNLIAFKTGFLACIKAVEDRKETVLVIELKEILLKI